MFVRQLRLNFVLTKVTLHWFLSTQVTANRLGATALAQVYKQLGDKPADVDNAAQLKGFYEGVQALVANDQVVAYHDKGDGGLFVHWLRWRSLVTVVLMQTLEL